MSRVLLTGATGFIGSHVARELVARGYDVHAIGRSRGLDTAVTWHSCDLLTPGAAVPLLRALLAESLLHLAWIATPGVFWSAPDNLDWVAATLQLFRAFADAGGQPGSARGHLRRIRLVLRSVDRGREPVAAAYPLRTRQGGDRRASARGRRRDGRRRGLGSRFSSSIGPGEPPGRLVADLIAGLRENQQVDCTDGCQERDFIHVKDVASAFADILAGDFHGSVNIASGECRPVASLIGEIGRQTGRSELIGSGAIPLPAEAPRRLAASTRRLCDLIGLNPDLAWSMASQTRLRLLTARLARYLRARLEARVRVRS